ncbi:MAG: prephenate dehydrogenase/arogenate dehydrogenase family protein [Bacteroidota bacterium]
MPEIAIIGYGRFGQLATMHLKKKAKLFVADKKLISKTPQGVRTLSIEEAAGKKHVVLAVPINQIVNSVKLIAPYLQPGSTVYDVCSVKEQPIKWMCRYLPSSVSIIGTHPLFGPDSAGASLKNRMIAVSPVRTSPTGMKCLKNFLESLHLDIVVMGAEEHDRLMASTLFLTQFVFRGIKHLPLKKHQFTTQNYKILMQLVDAANNDSVEMFRDMYKYNRFARPIPPKLIKSFQKLTDSIK